MPLFFFNLKNVGQDAVFVSICVILQAIKNNIRKKTQNDEDKDDDCRSGCCYACQRRRAGCR